MDTNSVAANAVFNLYELVSIIADNLDAISLVRSQAITRTFHKLIQDTSHLRARIGFKNSSDSASNALLTPDDQVGGDHIIPAGRWNPLLDWFTVRAFTQHEAHTGPVRSYGHNHGDEARRFGRRWREGVVSFAVLPHAYVAARMPTSSIYSLTLTTPLLPKIHLHIYDNQNGLGDTRRVTVRNEMGVTFGDMFETFLTNVSAERLGCPVVASIPGLPYGARQQHKLEMSIMDEAHGGWMSRSNMSQRGLRGLDGIWGIRCNTGRYLRASTVWYQRTDGEAAEWCKTARAEQSAFVLKLLNELRHNALEHQYWAKHQRIARSRDPTDEAGRWPSWPALALPNTLIEDHDEELFGLKLDDGNGRGEWGVNDLHPMNDDDADDDQKRYEQTVDMFLKNLAAEPYKVDWVCGIIFNRQD